MTLHLNAFRGEPAIAEFDWSFAPYHSSSPPFSTDVCSVLHGVLPPLQPGHGKITRLRVYSVRLNALFRLAFASATPRGLTSPHTVTRRLILQKARHRGSATLRPHYDSLTACKPTVSGTISLPSRGSFHLSLAVLVHYRSPMDTEAYGVVPTDSWQVARTRHYLGYIAKRACVSCTGLLPPVVHLSRWFYYAARC